METSAPSCQIEGCKRPYRAKGFCNVHFNKWRRGEMPQKPRHKNCTEAGCHKPRGIRGLCEAHYKAWLDARKGQPVAEAPAAPVEAAAPAPEATPEAPAEETKS